LNQMLQGKEGFAGEITLKRQSGESFPTMFSSYPLRDEEGHIYAVLTVSIDVTIRKRLENRLQKAKKMEALGLLAGGVAHDLNNILAGIVGYPELLLTDLPEGSKQRKPLEIILDSGKRAAAVVSDLLTVSRGAASSKDPLGLNEIAESFLNSPECRQLLDRHPHLSLSMDFRPDLLNVGGSEIHIRKSIMNLVINAIEACQDCRDGRVHITTENVYLEQPLRAHGETVAGEYALLKVSDNGKGISDEDLDRVFEPFYTKKIMGRSGTGLGLAVVWNTMQDHDGYVHVESHGGGTVFSLYFPVTREPLHALEVTRSMEDYRGSGEKILVVDDDEQQRTLAMAMLEKLGYQVTAVSGGEAAVTYLESRRVDLVVLDMIMDPGMNGRDTYERIVEIHPGQKAIIASGFSETEDVKAAHKLGVGQYIKKPYLLEKIGMAVRNELDSR
jgi:two-component system, cell cycle sensor histidine kinase and response regulator CckA